MKISDEIIGALSGMALVWSIGAMVKSQFIDKYDANGNLINHNEVFKFLYNAWNTEKAHVADRSLGDLTPVCQVFLHGVGIG
jgi:hypothetical protein